MSESDDFIRDHQIELSNLLNLGLIINNRDFEQKTKAIEELKKQTNILKSLSQENNKSSSKNYQQEPELSPAQSRRIKKEKLIKESEEAAKKIFEQQQKSNQKLNDELKVILESGQLKNVKCPFGL